MFAKIKKAISKFWKPAAIVSAVAIATTIAVKPVTIFLTAFMAAKVVFDAMNSDIDLDGFYSDEPKLFRKSSFTTIDPS